MGTATILIGVFVVVVSLVFIGAFFIFPELMGISKSDDDPGDK